MTELKRVVLLCCALGLDVRVVRPPRQGGFVVMRAAIGGHRGISSQMPRQELFRATAIRVRRVLQAHAPIANLCRNHDQVFDFERASALIPFTTPTQVALVDLNRPRSGSRSGRTRQRRILCSQDQAVLYEPKPITR